jgi:phosphotransferase system enzyme I (PtsI)
LENIKTSKHPFVPKLKGRGVSKGIAVGPAFVFKPAPQITEANSKPSQGDKIERDRFQVAQKAVLQNLERLVEKTRADIGDHEAEIFEAHQMMIQDEELVSPILFSIDQDHTSAEIAVLKSFKLQIQIFESSDSDYMRERALDLKDLEGQLLGELNPASKMSLSQITTPVILIAEDLTPSQTILLDRKNILGLVTEKGGETSHSAIIARTLGIPAVSGIHEALEKVVAGEMISIDGGEGSLFAITHPEAETHFRQAAEKQTAEKQKLRVFKGKPSLTQDLHRMSLYANIGGMKDAIAAKDGDAEGVGLFRTEFLFMERNTAPTLEEQTAAYCEVLALHAPHEVVIRTLDVGGDKPIDYIKIPHEENPFLGLRAIRYCYLDIPLFKTQIKAMLLANEHGNLSIMTPMVSRASEAVWARGIIDECHAELKKEASGYSGKPFKVGTMVEIPSLVFEMRELKEAVSFVSVGTNDLTQYSLAVDRMNPALSHLYSPYTLGFIRLMGLLAEQAIEHGLDLGICGELGGNDDFIPLWIAMGYQKLSMIPGEVLPKRALLSKLTVSRCKTLLKDVISSKNEHDVKIKLQEFGERERNR